MTKKISLAVAALITLAPAAQAADAGALTFGGQKLCTDVLNELNGENSIEYANLWTGWIMGYWSGLNAVQYRAADAWIGENAVNTDGGAPIYLAVLGECQRNRHQTLQDAVNAVYNKAKTAAQ
jgi:hypothetical protein